MARDIKRRTAQSVAREITSKGAAKVRKEYSELRRLANERIERAQAVGDLRDMTKFPDTRTAAKDPATLAKEYSQLTKFLSSKRSTEAGRAEIRRHEAAKITELGYENVTEENVDLFNQFMENFRRKYEMETPEGKKLLMDSDFAVEAFDQISERFTERTNARSMSRMFNNYLREQGMGDYIKRL